MYLGYVYVSHTHQPIIHKACWEVQSLYSATPPHIHWQRIWVKQHLPLALYIYWTATHSSIGISHTCWCLAGNLMPCYLIHHWLLTLVLINITFAPSLLTSKIYIVESNLVKGTDQQKFHYDKQSSAPTFTMNDKVWLSVPVHSNILQHHFQAVERAWWLIV